MSQVLDKELQHYMALLNTSQKRSILEVIKTFLPAKEKVERIDIATYNKEIREAEERIDRGEFFTHEEVEKQAETW